MAPKKAAKIKASTPVKKVGKSKKEKKDGPKRAMSAYMFFVNDTRNKLWAEMKKTNPEAKVTEVVKELGAKWRAMNDAAKAKYVTMAAKDKLRSEAERAKAK